MKNASSRRSQAKVERNAPGSVASPSLLPALAIVAVSALLAAGGSSLVDAQHDERFVRLRDERRVTLSVRADRVASDVAAVFTSIYEGLRTMARLPGVRAIDAADGVLSPDAAQAVQEIYNNLAYTMAMSEVYIVPADLRPDDPTARHAVPWTTFDELIVGRHVGGEAEGDDAGPEEIEIYEYRAMRDQIDWMRQHVPRESAISGLDYPAVISSEVVTCDNSRYNAAKPDDLDRSGLLISVPLFRPDGSLEGLVSAVILTHALRDLLPADGAFVLFSRDRGYFVAPARPGPWEGRERDILSGHDVSGLATSAVSELRLFDEPGGWNVWAGEEEAALLASAEARAADVEADALRAGCWTAAAILGAIAVVWRRERRQRLALVGSARALRSTFGDLTALAQEFTVDAEGAAGHAGDVARRASGIRDTIERVAARTAEIEAARRSIVQGATTCQEETRRAGALADRMGQAISDYEGASRRVAEAGQALSRAAVSARGRNASPGGGLVDEAATCAESIRTNAAAQQAGARQLAGSQRAILQGWSRVDAGLAGVSAASTAAGVATENIGRLAAAARSDSRAIEQGVASLESSAARSRERAQRARVVAEAIARVADDLGVKG